MHMRCHDFEDDDNVFVFVFAFLPVPVCCGYFEDDDMEEYLIITDTMVCTGCCATLDHIVTYLFKKVTNKGWFSSLNQFGFSSTFLLAVGKKVRGSQTSAENDPLVAVIKVDFLKIFFLVLDIVFLPR